jgi:thioredoxin 1
MAGENVLHFDDSNFESDVLNSDVPVLVDFWAEWCAPCYLIAPALEELAAEYAGKVKIGKVDVDRAPRTAVNFGIQNIPTVVLFDKGQAVERIVGARRKNDYRSVLEAQLGIA